MNNNTNEQINQVTTKPDIKAVFFDVDGTLVSFKTNQIPVSTKRALEALRKQGIKVIVATGRSIQALEVLNELSFDGFICFNGGLCATIDGEILHKQAMHAEDIKALVDYQKKYNMNFALMYHDGVFVHTITDMVKQMHDHINLPLPPLLNPDDVDFGNVLQANVFMNPEEEVLFMENVMPNCVASRWTPLFADVNAGGLNKYVGIEIFCKHFDIQPTQTMAFGDGGNDIAMLTHTAIGVAMGDANTGVKAIADYTTADVDDDGIWKALVHFGVLEDVADFVAE